MEHEAAAVPRKICVCSFNGRRDHCKETFELRQSKDLTDIFNRNHKVLPSATKTNFLPKSFNLQHRRSHVPEVLDFGRIETIILPKNPINIRFHTVKSKTCSFTVGGPRSFENRALKKLMSEHYLVTL